MPENEFIRWYGSSNLSETELAAIAAFTDKEMALWLQPIYRLSGLDLAALGQPASYEGLIRWDRDGVVYGPSFFLQALQGMQFEVFMFTAARALELLRDNATIPNIAVNLHPAVIDDKRFPWVFLALWERFEIEGHRLALEITEEAIAHPAMVVSMQPIREHGIGVGIDDFGAGFANFGQLHLLSAVATYIKLDRALISDCHVIDNKQLILSSAIKLFHNLGLPVVAEGIEHLAELEMLQSLGCDYGQGYLMGKATAIN